METNNLCLCCGKSLKEGERDYHSSCAKRLFGCPKVPVLPYSRDNISELAFEVIKSSTSVTGVQAKLALDINKGGRNEEDRLTIVGLWGGYILKPQSPAYKSMPELENATMNMAEASGIRTARHGLIRMSDGELAYITKRMDRGPKGQKYSMLDMCQLTNRLTEHKYLGSYSQLSAVVSMLSSAPLLDVQRFWEIVLFSWITGNSDMHCKNFSLISTDGSDYTLSPAYDLLAVLLTGIEDKDELAMPLEGSGTEGREGITGYDRDAFEKAMTAAGIETKVCRWIIGRMISNKPLWFDILGRSFLPDETKDLYRALIENRLSRLR